MSLNLKTNKIIFFCFIILTANPILAVKKNDKLTDQIINHVNFFVNREEEANAILQNLQLYKIVSVIGVTNIGKTEIVRKYANSNKNAYNLIWFFDSSLDLNEQFMALAKKINQTLLLEDSNKISEEVYSSQKEVTKYLSGHNNWLLVFDNLRLNQNNKLDSVINWNHNGHIIICSQDSKDLPNIIYVHKLDKRHALILLQKIFGREIENKALLERLVDIFDGYPGSIVRGALLLKENNYLSLEEYKNILAKSSDPIKTHMELVLKLLTDNDKKLLRDIAILNNQLFSKNLLRIISDNPDNIGESLYNLNRFGLIKNTDNNEQGNFFEMHDAVRDSVLQFSTLEEIQLALTDIINKLNTLMPKGVTSSYTFTNSDTTIRSNLEVLLENAEKYKVDIYKILELRKNLINYYMAILDHYNWKKMKVWLEQKASDNLLKINKMDNAAKINYSWYLVDMGMYEDFVKSSFMTALTYYNRAKEVVQDIKDQPELKSTTLLQIAQTQVFGGGIEEAEQSLVEVDKLIQNYPKADFDMGLYWFIRARIALARGNYAEALIFVDNNISAESHLAQDTFTAPTYILKSEILNFMGEYNQSYDIIKRIQKQEISNNHTEHEIHARILTQLSRAELGLELKEDALNNANIACSIFQKEIEKYKIDSVLNTEFATALVIKANALAKNGKSDEALLTYNEAEAIYFRRYNANYNKMDDINYLLSQGAKVACISKNAFWKKHFYNQLINNFDKNHPRVKEVENICLNSGI